MSQLSLFEEVPDTWTSSDDWETPKHIAIFLAATAEGIEPSKVLELGAGTGNIAQFLPPGSFAVERNPERVKQGVIRAPHCQWHCAGALDFAVQHPNQFDLIVGNPPFSLRSEWLKTICNRLLSPEGIVAWLLPTDSMQAKSSAKLFKRWTVVKKTEIIGRIAYLKNGKPESDRQVYDAIFHFQQRLPDGMPQKSEYSVVTFC